MKKLALIIFGLLTPTIVFAQGFNAGATQPTTGSSLFSSPGQIIATLYNLGITLGSIVFVLLLLYGGIKYLTAAGDEKATQTAMRIMVDAGIGIVIVLAAWAASNFILKKLGVNLGSATSTTNNYNPSTNVLPNPNGNANPNGNSNGNANGNANPGNGNSQTTPTTPETTTPVPYDNPNMPGGLSTPRPL